MRKTVLGMAAAAVLGVGFFTGTAYADPAPPVPPHRHYIVVNGEQVNVGPDFCHVDASANGFAQFHANVHLTDPGTVDVKSGACQ